MTKIRRGEVNIPSTRHPLLKLRISCFNCPKIKKLKSFEKLLRLGFYDKNSEGGGKYTFYPPPFPFPSPVIGLKRHSFSIKHYLHKSSFGFALE